MTKEDRGSKEPAHEELTSGLQGGMWNLMSLQGNKNEMSHHLKKVWDF